MWYKKYSLLILLCFAFVASSESAVQLITPKLIPLGQIKSGDVVHTEIRFVNSGTEQLIVQNVRTSCGCTAAQLGSDSVAPGDTAVVTVQFKSKGFRGQLRKSITVEFQNHDPESLIYLLDVEVIEELEVIPRYVQYRLKSVPADSLVHGEFTLKNNSDQLFRIKEIRSRDNTVTWTDSYTALEPGKSYVFKFNLRPKKSGFSYEQVVMETDNEKNPTVTIPIYVRIDE